MNTWVEDTEQGDWRFYTGKHTAVVWVRIDGWWASIGCDESQSIVKDQGRFKSLELAQAFAEQFIKDSESQSSECKGTEQ